MRHLFGIVFLAAAGVGAAHAGDPKDEKPPSKAFRLDDLLALPGSGEEDSSPYRADDYLKAAVSLQAFGER
jgi:hypothetical protein